MRKGTEVATIDVALVTLTPVNGVEIGLTTSNKVAVAPSTETTDAVKNIVKGVLIAQKPATTTVTGNAITLTDNVFNPDLVKILQGGTIYYWQDAEQTVKGTTETAYGIAGYKPPVIGDMTDKGQIFELALYSAIYNAAGIITGYEKCIYPNCQGQPVSFSSEDNTFRAPEYTINSAPDSGESPYEIEYVKALPNFETYTVTQNLTNVTSSYTGNSVSRGANVSVVLTPAAGYGMGQPTVTMGGTDITDSVYNAETKTITINGVIGNVVITATGVAYSITQSLTHVTSSSSATSIAAGAAFTATLTAEAEYEIDSVTVTMGGTDVTSTAYDDGVISIASVTGDIDIIASATAL